MPRALNIQGCFLTVTKRLMIVIPLQILLDSGTSEEESGTVKD